MGDLEEAKRLLGEVKSGLARIARIEGVFQIERDLTDALALLDNMVEPDAKGIPRAAPHYPDIDTDVEGFPLEPPEEPVEELMRCPECGVEMEPLSGGGGCKSTNEWRCVEGGHGVWWECAKCGSIDPRHINPIDESRGPGGVLDKAWWRVAAEEERRKKAEERKEAE